MRRTVLYSLMALALVLGLTLSMATPVMADVHVEAEKGTVWDPADGHPADVYLIGQEARYYLLIENQHPDLSAEVQWIQDRFALGAAGEETRWWDDVTQTWVSEDPEAPLSIGSDGTWTQEVTHAIGADHLIEHPYIDDAKAVINQMSTEIWQGVERRTREWSYTVQVIQPGIELEKTVDREEAQVGETVTYTFTITNTGDWPLQSITLADDELGDLTDELADHLPLDGVLASDASSTPLHITYTIQPDDYPSLENEATAAGKAEGFDADIAGAVVTYASTATVTVEEEIPVGGTVYPMNALIIVLPGLGLAVVIAGVVVYVRSRRGRS